MMWFKHTAETAPSASQEILRVLQKGFGFVPNLFAQISEAPQSLQAYLDLRTHFERCSLTPVEQQVVALAASVEHRSAFCVAAHSYAARTLVQMPALVLDALREGRELPDAKLNVLANFTRELVRNRGRVDAAGMHAFLAAGYLKQHVLDVVLGVTLKTFTNYASHIVNAQPNQEFESERWTPPEHKSAPSWWQSRLDDKHRDDVTIPISVASALTGNQRVTGGGP